MTLQRGQKETETLSYKISMHILIFFHHTITRTSANANLVTIIVDKAVTNTIFDVVRARQCSLVWR